MKLRLSHGTAPNINEEEILKYLWNAINNKEPGIETNHKEPVIEINHIETLKTSCKTQESSFISQETEENDAICLQHEPFKRQPTKDQLLRFKSSKLSLISTECFNQNITRAFTFSYFDLLKYNKREKSNY